jgi:two-component system nitrogen regulation response regulator NtrX
VIILTSESEDGQIITAAHLLRSFHDDAFSLRVEEETVKMSGASAFPGSTVVGRNLRDARQEFEKEFILRTLREQDWNISKTAHVLGIERSHLHRKIKSYGIEAEAP